MFKCECGKTFENAQSFNGHKSHCRIHAEACGKLAEYELRKLKYREQLSLNQINIAQNNRNKTLNKLAS